jgi:hypothetical protein
MREAQVALCSNRCRPIAAICRAAIYRMLKRMKSGMNDVL